MPLTQGAAREVSVLVGTHFKINCLQDVLCAFMVSWGQCTPRQPLKAVSSRRSSLLDGWSAFVLLQAAWLLGTVMNLLMLSILFLAY